MTTDVELRRLKNIAERNESLRRRLNVTQSEINEAQLLVNRKIAGQRRQAGSTEGVERVFASLINDPETLRQLGQVTELQAEAERRGFGSIKELLAVQRQFIPRVQEQEGVRVQALAPGQIGEAEFIRQQQVGGIRSTPDTLSILEETRTPNLLRGFFEASQGDFSQLSELTRAARRETAQRGEESFLRELKLAAIQVPTIATKIPLFFEAVMKRPVQTATQIPSATKEALRFTTSGDLAKLIRNEPGTVVGMAATEILLLRGAGRIKPPKLDLPKVKLTGKGREKFIKETIKTIEPDFETLQSQGRITGTRLYEIDIPTPKGKTTLKVLEFEKNGMKSFVGQEISKGKVKATLGGVTLETGKDGLNKLITRIVTKRNRGRLSNLEIQTFVEKAVVKSSQVKGARRITLTENEVKLVKQFNLKGLTPEQVREVLRKPLFSKVELRRRKGTAFTDAEFNLAKQLTKSEIVLGQRVDRIRISRTDSLGGGISTSKGILDLRTLEVGSGFIKQLEPVKLKSTKLKVKITKEGNIIPVGKIPSGSKVRLTGGTTSQIIIKKLPTPRRTPLSTTFAEQVATPLLKLKKKPVTSSVFLSVAKQIQKRKLKQAKTKQIKVDSLQATLRGIPRMVGGEGLTTSQLSQFVGGISTVEVTGGLLPPSSVSTLNLTQLNLSIRTDTRLLQRINTSLKDLSKFKDNTLIQQRIVSLTKVKTGLRNKLKESLKLKQKLIKQTSGLTLKPRRIKILPILKLPKGTSKTELVKALVKLKKQGLDVVVGMGKKQKIVAKNLPAFKALKFGRDFVDKNIAASFTLRKSGKKTKKKDIKPFNVGKKFRPSKRNPLFVVEKRKFRLDSPTEKRQIKSAPRNKRSNKKTKGRKK